MNSLTRDQLDLMFRKVVDTCEKKLYDPELNGVNWRHLAEARKERILAAASDEELEREFNELIKELKVDHAGSITRSGLARGKDGHQRYPFQGGRRRSKLMGFPRRSSRGSRLQGWRPAGERYSFRESERTRLHPRPSGTPPLGETTPVDIKRRDWAPT